MKKLKRIKRTFYGMCSILCCTGAATIFDSYQMTPVPPIYMYPLFTICFALAIYFFLMLMEV